MKAGRTVTCEGLFPVSLVYVNAHPKRGSVACSVMRRGIKNTDFETHSTVGGELAGFPASICPAARGHPTWWPCTLLPRGGAVCGSEAGPRGRPRPPALAGPDGALVCAASPGVEHVQSLSVLPVLSGSHWHEPRPLWFMPVGGWERSWEPERTLRRAGRAHGGRAPLFSGPVESGVGRAPLHSPSDAGISDRQLGSALSEQHVFSVWRPVSSAFCVSLANGSLSASSPFSCGVTLRPAGKSDG